MTLAEKLLGRRIEFRLSIFLSFETLENQPTTENDLISHVIYLRLWWGPLVASRAILFFFFFFFYPSFSSRHKIARSKSRLSGENIRRSRSIGVTRACYRVEENLKDKLSRIPVTHCYQIIRQTRWSCGLIYLARHFQHGASLTHRL